ncbi:DUF427 domain-containing protein [Deinococcus pimensis]|uniref:DUF427 domain-containing protein n=1 Tax=Deinococcus pimensis TaxID=309888 RepID=UPI000487829C|nr:DUF427 domain-containing protein [Deinococcus pimensis]
MTSRRVPPAPGQESVWDYPRPPRLERATRRVRVILGGEVIADSARAFRVLETSHPPVYYVPREDVRPGALTRAPGASHCEYKGRATYWTVRGGSGLEAPAAAWSYEHPDAPYEALAGHVAFYPARMDACLLDDEQVTPQPGDFYGGWITRDIVGPFKGGPGTNGW